MECDSEDLFCGSSNQMEQDQPEQASQQSQSLLEGASEASSKDQSHRDHPPKRKATEDAEDTDRDTGAPSGSAGKGSDPFPFLKDFFQFVSATRGSDTKCTITYRCKSCEKTSTQIKIHESTKSNLFRHIKAFHPCQFINFSKVVEENHKRKPKKPSQPLTSQEKNLQPSVAAFLRGKGGEASKKSWITQADMDKAILEFIVDTGQSFHVVEEASFINMVSGSQ